MGCNNKCQICDRLIISTSVTVVTVDGTDTLVIDIPLATYLDGCRYCIVIAQAIPDTATINMPVAISIGGVTTTVYPVVRCDCAQVTACAIRTRTKYPVLVSTNATGGVFKVLRNLSCAPNNNLASLPIIETAAPAAVVFRTVNTKSTTTKTKEVTNNA